MRKGPPTGKHNPCHSSLSAIICRSALSSPGEKSADLQQTLRSAIFLVVQKEGEETRPLVRNTPGLLKKVVISIGGVTVILLGVVGLFLPVLQGILLIIAGLGLLSISNSGLRKWIADLEKRYHSQGLGFKKIKMKTLPRRKLSHNYRNGRLEKGTNYDR